MKTITHEQADALRGIRPKVKPLQDGLADLHDTLAEACQHEDDPNCPICLLYMRVAKTVTQFITVPEILDAALLNGPHPALRPKPRTTNREPNQ